MAEQNKFEPTVYSAFTFSNPEGTVEQSNLTIAYWKDMIRLRIGMKVGDSPTDYKYEPSDAVYLTPTKAAMLVIAMDNVMSGKYKTSGVYTLSSYVGLCKRDNGEYLLSIMSLNKQNPENVISTSVYQFRQNHFIVNNIKVDKTGNITGGDEEVLFDFEVNMLKRILVEFVNAMTYSQSYVYVKSSQRDARFNTLFGIAGALKVNSYGGNNRIAGRTNAADLYSDEAYDTDIATGTIDDIM